VVANHPSWLDGLVLAAILPIPSRFVAGEILSRRALAGFLLRRVGAVFVERTERQRGVSDTDRLVEMAGQGQRLVMFPEGHLEPIVGLRRFRMGAFVVAARAGVPIVPIAIQGTRSMLPPGHHFPSARRHSGISRGGDTSFGQRLGGRRRTTAGHPDGDPAPVR
jgi:1-acyl-sn-glycerol-3-phosphate acyltransferase